MCRSLSHVTFLAPERRIFYIDVQQMAPARAEAFLERMKDQFKKKKIPKNVGLEGASAVEERFHVPAVDEDYWIPTRPNSNTRIETLPGACLALDTIIPLLDGRELFLENIIKEYQEGKKLWAYSCCPTTGEVAPGLISWAGITRKNAEVVKVTFDNGESIVCTPDHKFPVQTKGKVEAKDLQAGDSMFPFNTRFMVLVKKRLYKQVYNNGIRRWEFVHRNVMEKIKGTMFEETFLFNKDYEHERKTVVHHKNFNKYNNAPDNLAWMNWEDHLLFHRTCRANITVEKISNGIRNFHNNLTAEQKEERRKNRKKKPEKNVYNNKQDKIVESDDMKPKQIKQIKQCIVYPKIIFEKFVCLIKGGLLLEPVLKIINSDIELINAFKEANSHITRSIDFNKGLNVSYAAVMVKSYGYKGINDLRRSLGCRDKAEKNMKRGREKISFPKKVMDVFMRLLKDGNDVKTIIDHINKNNELIDELKRYGHKMKEFDRNLMNKMLKYFRYDGLSHASKMADLYNHKVISVEYLPNKQDTGTLTIDSDHLVHNYHTFAVSGCGVFTCNSNLGEIDDTVA